LKSITGKPDVKQNWHLKIHLSQLWNCCSLQIQHLLQIL